MNLMPVGPTLAKTSPARPQKAKPDQESEPVSEPSWFRKPSIEGAFELWTPAQFLRNTLSGATKGAACLGVGAALANAVTLGPLTALGIAAGAATIGAIVGPAVGWIGEQLSSKILDVQPRDLWEDDSHFAVRAVSGAALGVAGIALAASMASTTLATVGIGLAGYGLYKAQSAYRNTR